MKWKKVEKRDSDKFDNNEFVLYRRKTLADTEECELRWRDGRRKVMTPTHLSLFSQYLKKFAHKSQEESSKADGYISSFKIFKEEHSNFAVDSDECFLLWAELYISINHLPYNYTKFLNWRNSLANKKRRLNGITKKKTKKRKKTFSNENVEIISNPNTNESYMVIKDARHNLCDFDFIKSIYLYLQHARQENNIVKFKVIIASAYFTVNQMPNNRFNEDRHISLWCGVYEALINNKPIIKNYRDWQKKIKKRAKFS